MSSVNFSNSPPPTCLEVNGQSYPIDVDFRVWVEVSEMFKQLLPRPETVADNIVNLTLAAEMERLVFGEVIKQPWADALEAFGNFIPGYPTEMGKKPSLSKIQTYSFKHDMNWIVLAIRNQSGIDISYRRDPKTNPFHWWEFLLEFQSLTDEHYISKLMKFRGYEGDDKEYARLRDYVALPRELTAEEQKALDEFNALFD
jgi:hypothetical protein